MSGRLVPLWAVAVVSVLLLGTATVMALYSIALAGDGSFYLVRILDTERVYGPELRMFGNAVRQAPLLVATRAGVTDTHLLSVVFGIGLLVIPAAVWCVALVFTRAEARVFVAVAMVAGLCAGTTWFFAAGENVIAVPLTVLVAVLLWLPRPWRWRDALLAAAASAILVATYETSLVSSAVFIAWALWRSRSAAFGPDRFGGVAVAVISALSIVVAMGGIRAGQEGTPEHVQSLLYFVVSLTPWPLYLGLVSIAALVTAITVELGRGARVALLAFALVGSATALYGMTPTVASAFAARGGAPVAAIAVQLFLLVLWAQSRHRSHESADQRADADARWLLLVPVLFVALASYADVRALSTWSHSLDAFQTAVERTDHPLYVDDVLPADRRQVVWGWASSSLSLIVRGEATAGVLVDRNPSFVPFPPERAHQQLADVYVWRG